VARAVNSLDGGQQIAWGTNFSVLWSLCPAFGEPNVCKSHRF
jgi:hypothetical protein